MFTTGMRERDEDGRITETTTPDAVLEYFEEVEAGVVSSGDVASAFDVTTETARNKLAVLHERGEIARRRVGRTDVFWRTGTIDKLQAVVRSHNSRHGTFHPTDVDSLADVVPEMLREARAAREGNQ